MNRTECRVFPQLPIPRTDPFVDRDRVTILLAQFGRPLQGGEKLVDFAPKRYTKDELGMKLESIEKWDRSL